MNLYESLNSLFSRNNDEKKTAKRLESIQKLQRNQQLLTTVVLGISGCGINILNYMLEREPRLRSLIIDRCGEENTHILSSNIVLVNETIEKSETERIKSLLVNALQVYIVVGLGGITGSELLPDVCRIVHETGTKTKLIATMPFTFEGRNRYERAGKALYKVSEEGLCDTLLFFHNDRLIDYTPKKTPMNEAFILLNEKIEKYIFEGEVDDIFADEEIIID